MKKDISPAEPTEAEKMSWENMQANYSALMYVMTEQQALIGKLLEELVRSGIINSVQLERVTDIYGNAEILNPAYADLYKRYASYFLRVKAVMAENAGKEPVTPFPTEPSVE